MTSANGKNAGRSNSAVANSTPESDSDPQFRHADQLASELIRHLGLKGAERTCRENHWSGVLAAVKAYSKETH